MPLLYIEDLSRVWLYLALSWLYEQRADFADPLEVVEQLYADFDYPQETEGVARFMPPSGEAVGPDGIMMNWTNYLHQLDTEFSTRRVRS